MSRSGLSGVAVFLAALTLGLGTSRGEVVRGSDSETGLSHWRWVSKGISVELIQRLPDQTRAFFLGRGFTAEAANAIALGCVFQTIFKNTAHGNDATAIEYNMADWRVHAPSGTRPPKLKEVWARQWENDGLSQASRVAFHWSLLPTQQRFEPGDYNWGMSSYGLPPGSRFDLELVWYRNGVREVGLLRDVECPEDVQLEPDAE